LTFPDNRPEQLAPVLARLSRAAAPNDTPVAVSLGGTPTELVALDLSSGEVLWRQAAESSVAPQVGGRLVFTDEGPELVARDLATGSVVFREEDEGYPLIGAAGEGELSVAVLSTGGGVGAHTKLIVARGGDVAWTRDVDKAFGVPAVRAGMLFLPWSNQHLSAVDGRTGEELARVRISNEILGHALVTDGEVYTGQGSVFRLTSSITRGTRDGAAWFGASVGELPGTPAFMRDAYAPPPSPQSALHRVRQDFRPAGTGESVSLSDDNLYYTFYRLVFALDPQNGDVRWVHLHGADVVGGSAQPGGLAVADASGAVTFLSAADGRPTWSAETGVNTVVTTLRLGDFTPSGAPTGEAMSLADQLTAAAQVTDARLSPAQVYAVTKLASVDSAEVTGNLITLCDRQTLPGEVREKACEAMGERVEGPEQLLAALERHARFLEGTTAPPIGALSRAAARMEEPRAVPLLVAHLRDPATPLSAMPELFAALGALGVESAGAPIRDFLRLYHAEDGDDELIVALGAGIDALVAIQGPVARETLEEIAGDELGIPQVRGKARDAIAAFDAADAEAAEADEERDTPTEEEEDEEEASEEEAEDPRPERITRAVVADVLEPVSRELTLCLSRADGRPRSARVILRLDGDGAIEHLSVTPEHVSECVSALVRSQTFPANRRGTRQQVIYTLRR
jgi:outer membrane protein assembly factor BamB